MLCFGLAVRPQDICSIAKFDIEYVADSIRIEATAGRFVAGHLFCGCLQCQ